MQVRRHIPLGWAIPLAVLTLGTVTLSGLILAGVFATTRALNAGMPIYYVLCLVAGSITLGAGVRNRRREWALVGCATLLWTVGGIYYGLAGQPPPISPADVLWLVFYGPAVWGLIELSRTYAAKAEARLWLDGAIGALGVASAVLLFALPRIVHGHLRGAASTLYVVEPIADLTLVGVVIATLIASRAQAAKSWLVLGAGTTLFTVIDSVYVQAADGTFKLGGPLVAGWLIAFTLIALAAWFPSSAVPVRRSDAQSQMGWLMVVAAIPITALVLRGNNGAELPGEDALRLADQRMFAQKHSGSPPAGVQVKDALVRALSERMHELGTHMDGVASMCAAVCLELGLPQKEAERVALAAELHDIGKVAIPDAILRKPGPLNQAEWELMHQHTVIGERIAVSAPGLRALGPMIRSAHERWDGRGYPDDLSGDQIPLGAQVIFVCDAYDAMISERDYCAAVAPADAVAELQRCAGTQFSPRIVEAFCRVHAALEAADLAGSEPAAAPPDVLAA